MIRFTQYYLVSMILPGVINGILVLWALSLFECKFATISVVTDELRWLLFFTMAAIVTLIVGTRIESLVYRLITLAPAGERKMASLDDLTRWREKLMIGPGKRKTDISTHIIDWTEKLMSEYYFLNNIYPGCIIATIIAAKYASDESCDCIALMPVALSLVLFFYLIPFVMRQWLRELNSMLRSYEL